MPPSKYDKAKQEQNEAFNDLLKALEAQDGELTDTKSRQGQIAWRTVYNKMTKEGKNWLLSKNVKAREEAV